MGASEWVYFVPYQVDIQAALQELRYQTYRDGDYYKHGTKSEMIASLRDRLAHMDEQCAEPELREQMRGWLQQDLDRFEALPEPQTIDEQIAEVFVLNGQDGTHSILDMLRVGDKPDFGIVSPLSKSELVAVLGTIQPSHDEIVGNKNKLTDLRRRWEGTYIIVYKDDQPDEIFFGGFSGD